VLGGVLPGHVQAATDRRLIGQPGTPGGRCPPGVFPCLTLVAAVRHRGSSRGRVRAHAPARLCRAAWPASRAGLTAAAVLPPHRRRGMCLCGPARGRFPMAREMKSVSGAGVPCPHARPHRRRGRPASAPTRHVPVRAPARGSLPDRPRQVSAPDAARHGPRAHASLPDQRQQRVRAPMQGASCAGVLSPGHRSALRALAGSEVAGLTLRMPRNRLPRAASSSSRVSLGPYRRRSNGIKSPAHTRPPKGSGLDRTRFPRQSVVSGHPATERARRRPATPR
jgi:hypothetical protein